MCYTLKGCNAVDYDSSHCVPRAFPVIILLKSQGGIQLPSHRYPVPLVRLSWVSFRCHSCVTSDAAASLKDLQWHWILVCGQLSQALTVNRGEVGKVKLSCADLCLGLVKHEHIMLMYCAPPSTALMYLRDFLMNSLEMKELKLYEA